MKTDDKEFMQDLLKESLPVFNDNYNREIKQVKELGERIGYGNMMVIASALWRIQLEDTWGITTGAFLPTIRSFMLKKEGEKAEREQRLRVENFRKRLKG